MFRSLGVEYMAKMLSDMQLSTLCLKLSLVWKSGMGLEQSLHGYESDPEMFRIVRQLAEGEARGDKLYETMEHIGRFPAYVTGLLETGDASGKMEETLSALSEYYLRKDMRTKQVKAAVYYPAILLTLMLAVVILILTKVMPVFASVYAQLGTEMTGLAGAMLGLGRWLTWAAPVLCGLLACIMAAILIVYCNKSLRTRLTGWFKARFAGTGVWWKLSQAKIAQAIQMGFEAGMSFEEAVGLAERLVADDKFAAGRCRECIGLLTGAGSYDPPSMPYSLIMPVEYVEILRFGMDAGAGDAAMAEVANRMQDDAERALDGLIAKIEPGIVITASLMIGLILVSVMLPLMNIMSVIC